MLSVSREIKRAGSAADDLLRREFLDPKMVPPLALLDLVALTENLPAAGLLAGQAGTAAGRLADGVFEAEVCDEQGRGCAELALPAGRLMRPHCAPAFL